jgi:hypothetical protein
MADVTPAKGNPDLQTLRATAPLEALEADIAPHEMPGEEFNRVHPGMKWQETNRLRDHIPAAETAAYFDLYRCAT